MAYLSEILKKSSRLFLKETSDVMYRRLRDLREDSEYTQKYVADYLICSQCTYSRVENGSRELSVEMLIKLSELYNVSTDYLLGLSDFPVRIKHNIE